MSEIVRSAIIGEAVSKIFSSIVSKDEDGSEEGGNIERLEMAHTKMEAAIVTSNKWHITDVPLLRWRNKLKRAAQECEDMLCEFKLRALEDKETKEKVRQYSFPRRIAHATKSLVSSFTDQNNVEMSSKAVVLRFERLADGADDFMRYVQLGGAPRNFMFSDPLIGHLFAGKFVEYKTLRHGSQYYYFGIRPMSFEERGLEAMLSFIYEDFKAPHNNFRLGFMLRLSESTNVIGLTIKCLQLVTPHFKSTAEVVINELIQLPTKDFIWSSQYDSYSSRKHWDHVQNTLTRWFRPDPLCCQGYEHNMPTCSSTADASRLSSIFPESVSEVFLERHISVSEYNKLQGSSIISCISSYPEDLPPLKLRVLFIPHDRVDDFEYGTGVQSSAIEAVDGEKKQHTHVGVHMPQLDEKVLPKAIDHLYCNARATMYHISWNSRHGSAHFCVEKTKMKMVRTRRATRKGRSNKMELQTEEQINKKHCNQLARDFLKLMAVRTSDKLQGSVTKLLDMYRGGNGKTPLEWMQSTS